MAVSDALHQMHAVISGPGLSGGVATSDTPVAFIVTYYCDSAAAASQSFLTMALNLCAKDVQPAQCNAHNSAFEPLVFQWTKNCIADPPSSGSFGAFFSVYVRVRRCRSPPLAVAALASRSRKDPHHARARATAASCYWQCLGAWPAASTSTSMWAAAAWRCCPSSTRCARCPTWLRTFSWCVPLPPRDGTACPDPPCPDPPCPVRRWAGHAAASTRVPT